MKAIIANPLERSTIKLSDTHVPPINTRKLYANATNSIAKMGVQRVEDPLAEARGSAPWVPPINTRTLYAVVTNSIARKGQGRNSLAGSRGSAPCGVWGNAPTVPRPTNPKEAANKSAGSEASLPVTLRSRRSAPKLLYPLLAHCRARWARPHSRSTTPCPCFSPPNGYPTPKDTRKTSGTKPLVFSISRNIHFFSSAR